LAEAGRQKREEGKRGITDSNSVVSRKTIKEVLCRSVPDAFRYCFGPPTLWSPGGSGKYGFSYTENNVQEVKCKPHRRAFSREGLGARSSPPSCQPAWTIEKLCRHHNITIQRVTILFAALLGKSLLGHAHSREVGGWIPPCWPRRWATFISTQPSLGACA